MPYSLSHDHDRTRVGLVLGSGAARGWSLIGVVRALSEAGLKPDIVTGTSIGAVTGAAMVSGHLDDYEAYARSLKLLDMVSMLDISLSSGGLVAVERIARALQERICEQLIENLPTRFACVATNLANGREIWLEQGALRSAMWASAAMPGLFPPVLHDGKWLVDGALVNPVPVSLCRAMGADVVIAVNLNADLSALPRLEHPEQQPAKQEGAGGNDTLRWLHNNFTGLLGDQGGAWIDNFMMKKTQRPNPIEIVVGSMEIMQERMARSRLAGDPPDIIIEPPLGAFGALDFQRADELIAIGYEFTRNMVPVIEHTMRRFENR